MQGAQAAVPRLPAFRISPFAAVVFYDLTEFKGPKLNPAKLPVGSQQTVYDLFAQIFCAAIETAKDKHPVRYLSR